MKKRHCKFTTTPGTNRETAVVVPPSPTCPGQPPKFVEVAYKCRPLEFRSKIICENETIQLKCKRNARIAIYSATFGRVQFQSAQCLQPPGVDDESELYISFLFFSFYFLFKIMYLICIMLLRVHVGYDKSTPSSATRVTANKDLACRNLEMIMRLVNVKVMIGWSAIRRIHSNICVHY